MWENRHEGKREFSIRKMSSSHRLLLVVVAATGYSWWMLLFMGFSPCHGQGPYSYSYPVSSYSFPSMKLGPYEWRYVRVDLPPWFSSMIVTLMSDVNIDKVSVKKLHKGMPIMCFRYGGPPLPDVSDSSLENLALNFIYNGSIQGVERCLPFQENMTLILTNEQISPGAWYIGFFDGLGPERTQSKMINRGHTYIFSTSITVKGCTSSTVWGPDCNQTINLLSCTKSNTSKHPRSLLDVSMAYDARGNLNHLTSSRGQLVADYHLSSELNLTSSIKNVRYETGRKEVSKHDVSVTLESVLMCENSIGTSCIGDGEVKFYSLDIVGGTSQFMIMADGVKPNQTSTVNSTVNGDSNLLMCYARYNAMPLKTSYDYSADISHDPLIVQLPEIGRWYIAIHAVNKTNINGTMQDAYLKAKFCFSLNWEVYACPPGKAGSNCTWELHMLQMVFNQGSDFSFDSYYLPIGESMESADFRLEPLLSYSSGDGQSDIAWTYFLLDASRAAAGASIHVRLMSDTNMNYEIYTRFGGVPSIDKWDYFASSTNNSNGSMYLSLSDPGGETIDFYILYAREGTWGFGLKHTLDSRYRHQTTMSISLEECPESCSSHGTCRSELDETGSMLYSYCKCDTNHGGFDCSNSLVSVQGHLWRSIFLIGSNAAAILPALWALRQKAFAEWVLFTSSGISSGLYHACDVGTWCPLSFHVLQFMDFWLSFMAVVSTFVYMATIDEASTRAIHTCASIFTALLAVTGATRSSNIILVIAIGTSGLLIGWVLEFSNANRTIHFLRQWNLNICERWQNGTCLHNFMRTLHKRFRWRYLLLGFIALFAAGTSWKLENSESYWIWHSLWHITIYTSSFFFLCSTSVKRSNEENGAPEYELTRQSSSSRLESVEAQR